MATMIFLSVFSIILIYIGTWLYLEENKGYMLIICALIATAGIITGNEYVSQQTESDIRHQYNEIIAGKDAEIESLKKNIEENKSDTYYLGAEIKNQTLFNNKYYINFIDVENGNFYVWTDDYEYPDDVPYLLTMDSKGTANSTDDEILVVWMDMN